MYSLSLFISWKKYSIEGFVCQRKALRACHHTRSLTTTSYATISPQNLVTSTLLARQCRYDTKISFLYDGFSIHKQHKEKTPLVVHLAQTRQELISLQAFKTHVIYDCKIKQLEHHHHHYSVLRQRDVSQQQPELP